MSGHSSWLRRKLHKIPFLFKRCPQGNFHWFYEKVCICDWKGFYDGQNHYNVHFFKGKKIE